MNIFRRDDLPGDGPAICRTGYEQDISSRLVVGGITVLPDPGELFLVVLCRDLGISPRAVARMILRRGFMEGVDDA
jgi:hypothetical protein